MMSMFDWPLIWQAGSLPHYALANDESRFANRPFSLILKGFYCMIRKYIFILFLGFALTGLTAHAAHTTARLLLSDDTAAPGSTVLAGVELQMEPGWHTYWKSPGAAGEATEIKWQLPPGVTAGEIQWPLPDKLPPLDLTTYGYQNDVVLLVPLTLSSSLPDGPLNLQASVSWLECKESCIPGDTTVTATLNIGAPAEPSDAAPLLQAWQKKVPAVAVNFSGRAWWEKSALGDTRPLILQWPGATNGADFFPAANDNFEVSGTTEMISAPPGEIRIRKLVKKYSGAWPAEIAGVFADGSGRVEAKISIASSAPTMSGIGSTTPAKSSSQPLALMLLYAFIGGLILNIMPCVLPVIALKILGFVNEAKSAPRHVRKLGLVYALGVLASFGALAALVIGVQSAGHHAGWGMQFGSPVFIVCLTTLVTLVALNLFGVFEITLGGRALDTAGRLTARGGAPGAFFNGVLATALATPCTAPFLGAALGFAFLQPPPVILLIFLAAGLGLAAPYVLLSWNPAWLKFLPKPGVWMEKFKILMGFPMLATAIWLFNLAAGNYGKSVVWLGIFLVVLALAAWIFGEFAQRGQRHKTFAAILAVVLLVADYGWVLEKQLNWRTPPPSSSSSSLAVESQHDGIAWQPWSPEALTLARAQGRPVLVDFTADWCLTCQVNKRTSLEVSSVREKLKALNAITLLADYTHFPDNITVELQHFQRAGVPLVLVYPKQADKPAIVLPEVLTPGIVLAALTQAAE